MRTEREHPQAASMVQTTMIPTAFEKSCDIAIMAATEGRKKDMEFKMIFELDEERMKRDGIDIEACRQEFYRILDEVPEMKEVEQGVFVADDFGTRSCLMYFLRDCEWFMKYVCKWICEDPNATDDVISDYRELGIRCCYE